MSSAWEKVLVTRASKVEEIRRVIPGYGYSAEDEACKTDEHVCEFMVNGLHEAKDVLFNLTHTEFELQKDALSNAFQDIRDCVDIFSDEIKTRHFDWDRESTEKWLERIVDHDYSLILGLLKFGRELDDAVEAMKEGNQDMQDRVDALNKDLDDLVNSFKERDIICNIRDITLERTFQKIRAEMRG